MKRHLPLALLAAVVLGGLIYLVVQLRGGPAAPAPGVATTPAPSTASGRAVRDHRGAAPAATPRLPADPTATATDPGPAPDDAVVLDHRGKPAEPPVEKPKYTIEPTAIAATRLAIRPVVKRCAAQFAAELNGEKPRLQTVLVSHVENGTLTIEDLQIQTRDVPVDGRIVDCVRQGLDGLAVPASGHRDVERHPLTFPFDLPLR